jgi:hypothetical protein
MLNDRHVYVFLNQFIAINSALSASTGAFHEIDSSCTLVGTISFVRVQEWLCCVTHHDSTTQLGRHNVSEIGVLIGTDNDELKRVLNM